jgi:hypothetical protein
VFIKQIKVCPITVNKQLLQRFKSVLKVVKIVVPATNAGSANVAPAERVHIFAVLVLSMAEN